VDTLIRSMRVFVAVAESGSMAAAARLLDLSSSAVTQQIQKLEQQLNISLLHRNTRQITLTEAGQLYYQSCKQSLGLWQHTEQKLSELREQPQGELRISVPAGFATCGLLSQPLQQLLKSHEQLSIRLFVQDEALDLIANRIDLAVAIRMGALPDSSLVVRHLVTIKMILVAAPCYLEAQGFRAGRLPQQPADMSAMDWLMHTNSKAGHLILQHPSGPATLNAQVKMRLNNMQTLVKFVEDGLGFAILPELEIQDYLRRGTLVQLLPEWQLPSIDICAITSSRNSQPAKVKTAIDILTKELKAVPAG
jgi:LysR family transcriptional regulator, transcriptional activator for aaeXAB operon